MTGKEKANFVDGKYSIADLVDIKRLKKVFSEFSRVTGFTTGLMSYPDQEVLIGTGWREICKKFHRANPESEKLCKKSNTYLTKGLKELKDFNISNCGHGFVDGATPVIVRGTHIASLFTGQILLKKPDLEWFKKQAETYGYDKEKYLEALKKVPVVSNHKLKRTLLLLSEIAVMFAEQGLSQIEFQESRDELKKEIAEKEELFEELKESEEKFRGIFDNSTESIFTVDLGGNFTSANNFMAEFTGYTIDEIVGKNYREFAEPDILKEVYKAYNHLYRTGEKIYDLSYNIITKSGALKTISGNIVLIKKDGEIVGFQGTLRDVSEKVWVEEALKRSEERFSHILENAKDMIYRMSLPDENYEYVSPASEEIFGFTPDEMYENPKLMQDVIHPDWVDYFKEQRENLIQGHMPDFYEYQIIDKSGEVKWLNHRNVLIRDEEGNVAAIEGIVTDITVRKQVEEYLVKSEERYRTLVESTNDGIAVIQEGKFVYFNGVFIDILGYSEDDVIDQPFEKFINPDDFAMVVDIYRKRMSGEDMSRTYEFNAIKKYGGEIPTEISVTITEWDNKPAILCILRDITEREETKRLLITQRVLASTLNATSDLKYALYISLGMALEVSSMDSGSIYIVNDDMSLGLMVHDGLSEQFIEHTSHIDPGSTSARLIFKGDPVYSSHTEIAKKMDPIREKEGLKAMAVLPIHYEGRVISCLSIASHTIEEISESAKNALETIASEIGGTISRLMSEKKLMESEERFRNIVESSPMGMFMYKLEPDGGLVLIDSNPAANSILGVDISKLIGMTIEEAFPSRIESEMTEMFKRAAATGEPWYTEQMNYEDKKIKGDFEVYAFQTSPNKMAVMFLDVSEKIRAEEELSRYRSKLEELVQERTKQLKDAQEELIRKERLAALGRLTATVSHEIRNPLGTVRTSVFSIGDAINRNEMERVDRALKLAERNIIRCDEIIGDLLDYTRVKELQLTPTNIDKWLGELLDEHSIPNDIKCERELNSGIEIAIDRDQFRRAIINVVNNAIQAFDENSKGKKFIVKTGVSSNRLEIGVVDTGAGISDEIFEKIFDPLVSNKSFGVGMGLPIVRNIITQHGGNVEIEQMKEETSGEKRQGTAVLLWLPLVDESG